jgi:hypothetical protein
LLPTIGQNLNADCPYLFSLPVFVFRSDDAGHKMVNNSAVVTRGTGGFGLFCQCLGFQRDSPTVSIRAGKYSLNFSSVSRSGQGSAGYFAVM